MIKYSLTNGNISYIYYELNYMPLSFVDVENIPSVINDDSDEYIHDISTNIYYRKCVEIPRNGGLGYMSIYVDGNKTNKGIEIRESANWITIEKNADLIAIKGIINTTTSERFTILHISKSNNLDDFIDIGIIQDRYKYTLSIDSVLFSKYIYNNSSKLCYYNENYISLLDNTINFNELLQQDSTCHTQEKQYEKAVITMNIDGYNEDYIISDINEYRKDTLDNLVNIYNIYYYKLYKNENGKIVTYYKKAEIVDGYAKTYVPYDNGLQIEHTSNNVLTIKNYGRICSNMCFYEIKIRHINNKNIFFILKVQYNS